MSPRSEAGYEQFRRPLRFSKSINSASPILELRSPRSWASLHLQTVWHRQLTFIIQRCVRRLALLILAEAKWIQVFVAWMEGVCLLYPHRDLALKEYQKVVMELFWAVPNRPSIAIQFDHDIWDRYAKRPFCMDDRSLLNAPLFSQMVFGMSIPSGSKRPSGLSSGFSPTKCASVPCINWNKGFCQDSELCLNHRLHGKCCECGSGHRAKDNPECQAALQTRDVRVSAISKRRA